MVRFKMDYLDAFVKIYISRTCRYLISYDSPYNSDTCRSAISVYHKSCLHYQPWPRSTKTWNEPQRPTTTQQRHTTTPQRHTTTYNDPKIWLQRVYSLLKETGKFLIWPNFYLVTQENLTIHTSLCMQQQSILDCIYTTCLKWQIRK
jgi:hypothetical protein